jgi:glycosyltransferase involved in cell wall biosynthesis
MRITKGKDYMSSNKPKISVVVPLYNKVAHISRTIESVLSQSMQDFEVIVVNDASTDGGEDIVKQYSDQRICLVERVSPGAGGHAARNLGILKSKSELIAFLDADDEYKPCFLETILRLRKEYPLAGAYSTAYDIVKESGRRIMPKFVAIPPSPWEGLIPNYFKSALGVPPVWSSATVVPKNIFDKVGFFPEGEIKGGDLDMWLRIALKYSIAFSNYIGATYYCNASNRVSKKKHIVLERKVIKTAFAAIKNCEIEPKTKGFLRDYVSKKRMDSVLECISCGEIKLAKDMLLQCSSRRFIGRKLYLFSLIYSPELVRKCIFFIKSKIRG